MVLRARTPFVGRTEELGALVSVLEDARAGAARTALVIGHAGSGKTRLVDELLVDRRGDFLVLRGACPPVAGAGLPYAPFVSALRPILTPSGDDSDALARWPTLGALAPEMPGGGAGVSRLGLFEAVLALLRDLSTERPVVLALDDLHWADPSTADLVGHLCVNLVHERVAVVLGARPATYDVDRSVAHLLAEVQRLPSCERVDLHGLSRPELADLAAQVTGDELDAVALDRLTERSGGLPFFAEELLRVEGARTRSGVSGTVTALIGAELAGLPAPTVRLLTVAAVAGREVPPDLLAEVLDTDVDELLDLLQHAVDRAVLVTTAGGVAFRHDLFREILLDRTPGDQRRRWHARVAEVLGVTPRFGLRSRTEAELAHHRERAGDLAGAVESAVRAAADAGQRGAVADRALHLDQVLRLWDSVSQAEAKAGRTRGEVAQEVAACHWLLGDPKRASEYGALALLDVDAETAPDRYAAVAAQQAGYLFAVGERRPALDLLGEAEAVTATVDPSPGRAQALAVLARLQQLCDDDVSALLTSARAREAAQAASAPAADLHARVTELSARQALGQVEEGVAGFDDALAEATRTLPHEPVGEGAVGEVDHPALVHIRLAHNAAFGLIAHGWPRRALSFVSHGLDTIDRLQLGDGYRSNLLSHRALALLALGHEAEARAVIDELPRLPRSRVRISATEAQLQHALLVDDRERAMAYLEQDSLHEELLTPMHVLRVEAHLRLGRYDVAAADAEQVVTRLEAARMVPYVAALCDLAIEAHLATERRDAAVAVRHLLQAARRAAERCADRPPPPDTRIRLALAEARASELLAGTGPSAAAWQAAYDLAAASELSLLHLRAAVGLGRALAAAGERTAAAEVLTEARELAAGCGARHDLVTIESLMKRARLGPHAPRGSGDPTGLGLTSREAEVLACLVEGLTNQEIGSRLFISTKTASVHVSNILAKLGVPHRRAAAARGRELGVGRGLPT